MDSDWRIGRDLLDSVYGWDSERDGKTEIVYNENIVE